MSREVTRTELIDFIEDIKSIDKFPREHPDRPFTHRMYMDSNRRRASISREDNNLLELELEDFDTMESQIMMLGTAEQCLSNFTSYLQPFVKIRICTHWRQDMMHHDKVRKYIYYDSDVNRPLSDPVREIQALRERIVALEAMMSDAGIDVPQPFSLNRSDREFITYLRSRLRLPDNIRVLRQAVICLHQDRIGDQDADYDRAKALWDRCRGAQ